VPVLRYAESDLPEELRVQVLKAQIAAWSTTSGEPGPDPALSPLSLLLVEQGTVLSSLTILSKEIVHGGASYFAGGLSSVVTPPNGRGGGYGHQLVVAAREFMKDSGFDLGLFTCDRPLQRFYEGAGWSTLIASVLIGGTAEDPFPSDGPGFDKVTMGDFMSEYACSNRDSFHSARICVYPGDIARLW
jgi:aminoglycoside 2'-N-acetyltransferase I